MDNATPRLASITGVSRALIATLGVEEAVRVMVVQFGWDIAFQALAALEGEDACRALFLAIEMGPNAL